MLALRQKIALGFGGLLLIVLVLGIQSIVNISTLGDAIDVILRENYRSVLACQQMKEALERIDSGLLFILIGENAQGHDLIFENKSLFENALEIELHNVTLPGEEDRAEGIRELYGQYKALFAEIEDPSLPPALRHNTYFARLLPLFTRIKATADEILQMNQQNMMDANNRARRSASHARRRMYILVFVGTALAAAFIVLTRRWILQPIRRLIRSAEEIRAGNLDLVVQGDRRDEIGQLSEAFNDMTASLREFRRTDQAKLIRIQHATQRAFDSLPDAVAVIDPQGDVEVATELARKIFGLKPGATVIGLERTWLAELYAEAMKTGRHASLPDHRLIQEFLEGEERYFRPEAIPILDSQRLTAGAVLVLQDVTQLRQQDDLKRGVIRTVSHQLKTPLTSIRMAIHLLLEEKVGPLTEKQAELLVTAREDSDRLNAILSSLLDISRIESGQAQLEFRAVSPRTILTEARESSLRTAQDQGVDLLLDMKDDLPFVWVDTTRIGLVFTNLLTNALKYTPAGGTITLSARAEEACVRFTVSDTGPGIPAQYIGRVFEPFFRVPGAEKPQGAGLGLAIVKEIVEAHRGTVVAESREGKGASFSFTLHRADQPLEVERNE
jgi:two-component system, NtrC family, sensor histidine kinase KinB